MKKPQLIYTLADCEGEVFEKARKKFFNCEYVEVKSLETLKVTQIRLKFIRELMNSSKWREMESKALVTKPRVFDPRFKIPRITFVR